MENGRRTGFENVSEILSKDIPKEGDYNALKKRFDLERELSDSYCAVIDALDEIDYRTLFGANSNLFGQIREKRSKIKAMINRLKKPLTTEQLLNKFQNSIKNEALSEYDGYGFQHSLQLMNVQQHIFKIDCLHEFQLKVINAVLTKRDVFVLMPTGGGKSLTYQIPGVMLDGLTVIISPLKSLIIDQVENMRKLKIRCDYLTGETLDEEKEKILQNLNEGTIDMLYTTIEQLVQGQKLRAVLTALHKREAFSLLVIDECHCISEWGPDFRTNYYELKTVRRKYSNVPVIALTATANLSTQCDVFEQFDLHNAAYFVGDLNRSNLQLEVQYNVGKKATIEYIVKHRNKHKNSCAIIFCRRKDDCDMLAEELIQNGLSARSFHSDIDASIRKVIQEEWQNNTVSTVCATIGFAMGIDKNNVRYIFHYGLPHSLQLYSQQIGRGGRDKILTHCILFYVYGDIVSIRKSIELKALQWQNDETKRKFAEIQMRDANLMYEFASDRMHCRRKMMLNSFNQHFDQEHCASFPGAECDNCQNISSIKMEDVTENVKYIIQHMQKLEGKNQLNNTVKILVKDLKQHALFTDLYAHEVEQIFHVMIKRNILVEHSVQHAVYSTYYVRLASNLDVLQKVYLCVQRKVQTVTPVDVDKTEQSTNIKMIDDDKVCKIKIKFKQTLLQCELSDEICEQIILQEVSNHSQIKKLCPELDTNLQMTILEICHKYLGKLLYPSSD